MKQRNPKLRNQRGFTLVELMISVVIIGVLAGTAIPMFTQFVRDSKVSEAPLNLRAISNGAVAWFNETHNNTAGVRLKSHFPHKRSPHQEPANLDSTTTPTEPLCVNGTTLYKRDSSRWEKQPWQSLKFGLKRAHYFQYTYTTQHTGPSAFFSAVAQADVSCRNQIRSFIQCGTVNGLTGEIELSKTLDLHQAVNGAVICNPSPATGGPPAAGP